MIDEKRFSKNTQGEALHNIIMENRRKISVSGVEDVESFDDVCVMLYTGEGMLEIKGDSLHINKLSLDSGEVIVEGEICSLIYKDDIKENKGSFFGKLFK